MLAFLHVNTLFKTIEYRLDTKSNLEINELSSSSMRKKTVPLNSLKVESKQNNSNTLRWLIIALGIAVFSSIVYFSSRIDIVESNLMSLICFSLCVLSSSFIIAKPSKSYIYKDLFSDKKLFELKQEKTLKQNAINYFIRDLNKAIQVANKAEQTNQTTHEKAQRQYNLHNKNIDNLYNSGLINEALYKRVCKSMHDQFFGQDTDAHPLDNVIYLPNSK